MNHREQKKLFHGPRHAISSGQKTFPKNCRPPWLGDEKSLDSKRLLKQLIGVQK